MVTDLTEHKKAWRLYLEFYRRPNDDADSLRLRATLYADTTADIDLATLTRAMRSAMSDSARMLLPSELRARVCGGPTETERANGLARALIASVGRRGYAWAWIGGHTPHSTFDEALQAEFGADYYAAVAVIHTFGGWARFHDAVMATTGDSGTAFFAQLRETCAGAIRRAAARSIFPTALEGGGVTAPRVAGEVNRVLAIIDGSGNNR